MMKDSSPELDTQYDDTVMSPKYHVPEESEDRDNSTHHDSSVQAVLDISGLALPKLRIPKKHNPINTKIVEEINSKP